ncbi:FecR family protein [Mucilaginibacter psychrotolerans]|uniref:FecR family protein n=1 Tax=Mucilaginibacter psychrotolerans TaxID=1524096 RepID=A0A4Y8S904_9SPHI|nr:FecR domain-containing protein [Mucilaginibacter psychrotolerans]TFF35478.1 FecR family protein [Mucilaginibacter psychrotolerans]
MDLQKINDLLSKYEQGTASESEIEELNQWYREIAYQDAEFPESEDSAGDAIFKSISSRTRPVKKFNRFRWMAAASIFLVSAVTVTILFIKYKSPEDRNGILAAKEILPGGNKATLILANGTKVLLADASDGQIASQNGMKVTKAADGKLIYTVGDVNKGVQNSSDIPDSGAYNTITTPKGGQYQVVLSDGSRVWLNAYSSLKFPVSFKSRKDRRVELSGEGYFEIAHDKMSPFRVLTQRQTVEVLGTHFNINAYPDDSSVKTTLLEGSVRINSSGKIAVLTPGQQSNLTDRFIIEEVNTQEIVAWKDGYFNFDDEKLDNIMKSISRWYNVDIVYQDEKLKNETFGAVTNRSEKVSTLLKMMEQTGNVRFMVSGSTITVSQK